MGFINKIKSFFMKKPKARVRITNIKILQDLGRRHLRLNK